MSRWIFVRHGQASLGSDNYDQLSDLGRRQCAALGASWAVDPNMVFERVLVGPLHRHRQSLEAISAAMSLPEAVIDPDLSEHSALEMLERHPPENSLADSDRVAWFDHFDGCMRRWIGGEACHDDIESWQQARQRAARFLRRAEENWTDDRVLVVTSGGLTAMIMGELLGLSDIKIYDLSLEFRNSAWMEVRINRRGEARLAGFNLHPHLVEPDWITYV